MREHPDRAVRKQALWTIRNLIQCGFAGLDAYDEDIFAVDAPADQIEKAEIALDHLGADFFRHGAHDIHERVLQCRLPRWLRTELALDEPDPPKLLLPLASRRAGKAATRKGTAGTSPPGGAPVAAWDGTT